MLSWLSKPIRDVREAASCSISSRVLNIGTLYLAHTISTLPFLQKPSGQQTNNLLLFAYSPSSSRVMGDSVVGSKYMIMHLHSDRWYSSQLTCWCNLASCAVCLTDESQLSLRGFSTTTSGYCMKKFSAIVCQFSALSCSMDPAKNTDGVNADRSGVVGGLAIMVISQQDR